MTSYQAAICILSRAFKGGKAMRTRTVNNREPIRFPVTR